MARRRCGSGSAISTPRRIASMTEAGCRRRVLCQAGDPPLPGRDGAAHPRPVRGADDSTTAGAASSVWTDVSTGDELYRRLRALPGFGDEKSRIFVAVLGKRIGVQPDGWRDAAGKFGDDTPRSVADSTSPETLAAVRQWKRAQKAAKLDKQDRPLTQ